MKVESNGYVCLDHDDVIKEHDNKRLYLYHGRKFLRLSHLNPITVLCSHQQSVLENFSCAFCVMV